jgi:hypothetical protein
MLLRDGFVGVLKFLFSTFSEKPGGCHDRDPGTQDSGGGGERNAEMGHCPGDCRSHHSL